MAQEISWEIEDNFRLLKNRADQQWIKKIALQSSALESTTITTDEIKGKWESVPPTYYDKHKGIYEPEYLTPLQWNITVNFNTKSNINDCTWTINDKDAQGPCKNYKLPESITPNGALVKVKSTDNTRAELFIKPDDILIIGIGDSYASGEGVPDVSKRWFRSSDWWDNKCHRSLYSWQVLSAARLAAENPHKSITFLSRACSGALISELLDKNSAGAMGESNTLVNGNHLIESQLSLLTKDLCLEKNSKDACTNQRQPNFVLLSIGGNDARFSEIIKDAILGKINSGIDLKTEYRNYAVKGTKYLREEYPKLAKKIIGNFPSSKILMTIYPDPLHRHPSAFCGIDEADGKQYLRLKSSGLLGTIARWFGKKEENREITALYDDFVVRLTGSHDPIDDDYKGILQIGENLSSLYQNKWITIPLRRGLKNYDQANGFQTRGYCVPGNDISGRWFLTIDDSEEHIGGLSGSVHPNIFGQLYYTSKVFHYFGF